MSKDLIKRCPFCGSEVVFMRLLPKAKMFCCKNSEGCGAIVGFFSKVCSEEKGDEEKLKAWNRRTYNG